MAHDGKELSPNKNKSSSSLAPEIIITGDQDTLFPTGASPRRPGFFRSLSSQNVILAASDTIRIPYRRARSSQNVLKILSSPTIPENQSVSHMTGSGSKKKNFRSENDLSQHAEIPLPLFSPHRQRSDTIKRDAESLIFLNIMDGVGEIEKGKKDKGKSKVKFDDLSDEDLSEANGKENQDINRDLDEAQVSDTDSSSGTIENVATVTDTQQDARSVASDTSNISNKRATRVFLNLFNANKKSKGYDEEAEVENNDLGLLLPDGLSVWNKRKKVQTQDDDDDDYDEKHTERSTPPPPTSRLRRLFGLKHAMRPTLHKNDSRLSVSDMFYLKNTKGETDAEDMEDLLKQIHGEDYIPPPDYTENAQPEAKSPELEHSKNHSSLGISIHSITQAHNTLVNGLPTLPSFDPVLDREKMSHLAKMNRKRKLEARITVNEVPFEKKKEFINKLCEALMLYGAPPHRLEEYMVMTSRVLGVEGQFIYFPGCMIVAYTDPETKVAEVELVRTSEGVNLSKLHDTHKIYKLVIHDTLSSDEAAQKLKSLMEYKALYPDWLCVLFYGVGLAMVCPFAFNGNWVDMPICFFIGCCVGVLKYYVAPRSPMYLNVFEVASSIVVSFLARAIGSVRGGNLFCFSAMAQGLLALILPGFIILTGSLELQLRNIVNGSVRMIYAIIYSFFLSFGITIGAALYGWIDKGATSNQTCSAKEPLSPWYRFIFVPCFSIILALINQANKRQLPPMVGIACAGYVVSYFSSIHFSNSSEFTAALAAIIIGVLSNLYSRIYKGLAISAMLPAIFVQVPSGIASQSSLLAGILSANEIVSGNHTTAAQPASALDSLSFGFSMIQVAIGISVGLFTASILVYPFGKKSTALFTM